MVWLHPEAPAFGIASPRTLGGSTASVAVMVDDVDAHFRHAKAEGAPIDYEPVDQPYGYREYSARDSEGAPVVVHEALGLNAGQFPVDTWRVAVPVAGPSGSSTTS